MTGRIPVRVAVRIRPLNTKELTDGSQNCLAVTPDEPQIVLTGTSKAFTYDHVFQPTSAQQDIFTTAVQPMLANLFIGYNVTVLAYGQTSSGKTYTMGTSDVTDDVIDKSDVTSGVIPRAMLELFSLAEKQRKSGADAVISISFIEIYKEQLFDLLCGRSRDASMIELREDAAGRTCLPGVSRRRVDSPHAALQCLTDGGRQRATAATAMNSTSSRSHAVLTVHVETTGALNTEDNTGGGGVTQAQLHLVDLAGSERVKKTLASGDRLREGININRGLLCLGNVISALCEAKSAKHIPYRDSKLTRLLQDSLGGNSHTLMIACVSPSDCNLEETVSTLRYADRARKIKNKPVVNRDVHSEVLELRRQVRELQSLMSSGQTASASNARDTTTTITTTTAVVNDECRSGAGFRHHTALREEIVELRRNLQEALCEQVALTEKLEVAECACDDQRAQLATLHDSVAKLMQQLDEENGGGGQMMTGSLVTAIQQCVANMQSRQAELSQQLLNVDTAGLNSCRSNRPSGDSSDNHSPSSHPVDNNNNNNNNNGDVDDEQEDEIGRQHASRANQLSQQLRHLNQQLAVKQSMASVMLSGQCEMDVVHEQYNSQLSQLQQQVQALNDEKLELNKQLKRQDATSTMANKHRLRIKELEVKTKELQQQIKEQQRVVRMKKVSDDKVETLNKEIREIKQAKVKLVKQIKEDSERFRQWRLQKDKEVVQLRAQDRRRQLQLVRATRQHVCQENVMRRKMEQAMAAQRRLQAVLERRADARQQQQQRATSSSLSRTTSAGRLPDRRVAGDDGAATDVRQQLQHDMELAVSRRLVQRSLDQLIEDRRTVTADIKQLEEALNADSVDDARMAELTRQQCQLQHTLTDCTRQISELQLRLIDTQAASPASRNGAGGGAAAAAAAGRPAWITAIGSSMGVARAVAQQLYDECVNSRTEAAFKDADAADLQLQLDGVSATVRELQRRLEQDEQIHQTSTQQMQWQHEQRMLLLLKSMSHKSRVSQLQKQPTANTEKTDGSEQRAHDSADEVARLKDQLRAQSDQIELLSELHQLVSDKNSFIDQLQKQLAETTPEKNKTSSYGKYAAPQSKSQSSAATVYTDTDDEAALTSDSDADNADDPDWQQTPLFRRICRIRSRVARVANQTSSTANGAAAAVMAAVVAGAKRDSSGRVLCGCRGQCKRQCACRSAATGCSERCACAVGKCSNRQPPRVESDGDVAAAVDAGDSWLVADLSAPAAESTTIGAAELNSTFVVPPADQIAFSGAAVKKAKLK